MAKTILNCHFDYLTTPLTMKYDESRLFNLSNRKRSDISDVKNHFIPKVFLFSLPKESHFLVGVVQGFSLGFSFYEKGFSTKMNNRDPPC